MSLQHARGAYLHPPADELLLHPRFVHQLAHRRNAQFDRRPVRQLGGAGRLHAHAAETSVTSAFRHCLRVRNCLSDNLTASCGGCLKMSCCFECVRCCRLLGLCCAGQGRVGRFYTRHRSWVRVSGLRNASDLARVQQHYHWSIRWI